MAKESVKAREAKRVELCQKYAERRDVLRGKNKSLTESAEAKFQAMLDLQKLPRDSSRSRQMRRCALTGRARGYLRRFGLSRIKFREMAVRGDIPGLRMSSW